MLPINLLVYTRWTYSADVVDSLDWTLFVGLVTVCYRASPVADRIGCRRVGGDRVQSTISCTGESTGQSGGFNAHYSIGTVSLFGPQAAVWDQDASFYIGVALPAFFGLALPRTFRLVVNWIKT
jgi:hypothetical protein